MHTQQEDKGRHPELAPICLARFLSFPLPLLCYDPLLSPSRSSPALCPFSIALALSFALSSRRFSVSRGIVHLAHTVIVGRGDLSDRVVEVCHFPPFPAAATGARRGRGLGGRGLRARRAGRPAGAVFPRKSANESSFHAESRPANVVPLQHTRAPLQAPPSWEKSEPQRSLPGGISTGSSARIQQME